MTAAERAKDRYLRRKYGITFKKFSNMLVAQDGKCAICRRQFYEQQGTKRRPQVDHNHKTGKVRGLLCYYCNKFLVGRHTFQTIKPVYEYLKRTEKGK